MFIQNHINVIFGEILLSNSENHEHLKIFKNVNCVVTNRSEDQGMRAKSTLCNNTDYAKQKKQIKVVDNNVASRGLSISVCCFVCFTQSVPQG